MWKPMFIPNGKYLFSHRIEIKRNKEIKIYLYMNGNKIRYKKHRGAIDEKFLDIMPLIMLRSPRRLSS